MKKELLNGKFVSCLSRREMRLNNPYFPKAPLVAEMSVPYFPTLIPLFSEIGRKNKGIREWADDTNPATKGAFMNKGLDYKNDNIHFAHDATAGLSVAKTTFFDGKISLREGKNSPTFGFKSLREGKNSPTFGFKSLRDSKIPSRDGKNIVRFEIKN